MAKEDVWLESWTLFSVGIGLLPSFIIGVALGMIMAYRRDSWLDNLLSLFASITTGIQPFLLGIMIIVFVGVQWRLVDFAKLRGSTSPGVTPGFTISQLTLVKNPGGFNADIFPFEKVVIYNGETPGGWGVGDGIRP